MSRLWNWFKIYHLNITLDGMNKCLEMVRDPQKLNDMMLAKGRLVREIHRLKEQ